VNPGKKRTSPSHLARFLRFSFGPPHHNLAAGLDQLVEMIRKHYKEHRQNLDVQTFNFSVLKALNGIGTGP